MKNIQNKNNNKVNAWTVICLSVITLFVLLLCESFINQGKQSDKNRVMGEIAKLDLNDNEINQYKEVLTKPYIQQIRIAFNGYLDGSNTGMKQPGFAIKSVNNNGIISGLDSFNRDYYKSKFEVLYIDDNQLGGKNVTIIFCNKPDKIFTVWVYTDLNGDFPDFRTITLDTDSTNDVNNIVKALGADLNNDELSL